MEYDYCDNVDCKNPNDKQRLNTVFLKKEFGGDTANWCINCCERDTDFISICKKKYKKFPIWTLDEEDIKKTAEIMGLTFAFFDDYTVNQIAKIFKKKVQSLLYDWNKLLKTAINETLG